LEGAAGGGLCIIELYSKENVTIYFCS
jgi:hypothetical protein